VTLIGAAPGAAQSGEFVRAPKTSDPFEYYSRAADEFGQFGWIGTSGGTAERITLRIDKAAGRIGIELPPGTPPDAADAVAALLKEQGRNYGKLRRDTAGNGPLFGGRLNGLAKVRGWNRNEVRLDLDRLVSGLRKLGGNPVFLGVRTAEELEVKSSPPPQAGGLFEGSRIGFYRLRPSGNGVLVLQYRVPARPALAVLVSGVMWFLFPLLAAGAARMAYRPPQGSDPAAETRRWRKPVRVLRYVVSIGAYLTLFFQEGVLRLIWLPIREIPEPYNRLEMWIVPFCFVLHGWAGAAWAMAGPATSDSRAKSLLLTLGAGLGFGVLYLALMASTVYGMTNRDPFWALRWVMGGILIVVAGMLLFAWSRSEDLRREGAKAEAADGPIPDSLEGRRDLLRRIAARMETPEEQRKTEAQLKKLPARYQTMAAVSRQLTYEEKSWLILSDRLSRRDHPGLAERVARRHLQWALALGVAGVTCFFLPSLVTPVVALVSSLLLTLFLKKVQRDAMALTKTMKGDIEVARLLDDPRRFVDVLRRFEPAEQHEDGPKTEFTVTRRLALEQHLLDREHPPPTAEV
jgi:hypothetical protein